LGCFCGRVDDLVMASPVCVAVVRHPKWVPHTHTHTHTVGSYHTSSTTTSFTNSLSVLKSTIEMQRDIIIIIITTILHVILRFNPTDSHPHGHYGVTLNCTFLLLIFYIYLFSFSFGMYVFYAFTLFNVQCKTPIAQKHIPCLEKRMQ